MAGSASGQLQWQRVRTTWHRDVHADIMASDSRVHLSPILHQAELADLRSQNDLFKSEQRRLESEIEEAEVRSWQQERRIQQRESSAPNSNTTVLPHHQDSPLLRSRRRAFHIIPLPLRDLPHPLHPLLPSHPLPLAQDSIARLVAMTAHLPHPLIAKVVLCMFCVCSASMMTKIALSVQCTQLANCAGLLRTFLTPLLLRTPALPLLPSFLPSHRTRDDTAPFTRSSVLVYNHPRWHQPGERSIENPIDAIDSVPFSFA